MNVLECGDNTYTLTLKNVSIKFLHHIAKITQCPSWLFSLKNAFFYLKEQSTLNKSESYSQYKHSQYIKNKVPESNKVLLCFLDIALYHSKPIPIISLSFQPYSICLTCRSCGVQGLRLHWGIWGCCMDVGKSRSRKGTASPLAGWSGSVGLYSPLHLLYNTLRHKKGKYSFNPNLLQKLDVNTTHFIQIMGSLYKQTEIFIHYLMEIPC